VKAKKPNGARHRDNIDGLISTDQANWSKAPLRHIRNDSDNQGRTDSSARQFGRVQNAPGGLQGFFQNSLI